MSNSADRELEMKWRLHGTTLEQASVSLLGECLMHEVQIEKSQDCETRDLYFTAPKGPNPFTQFPLDSNAQFIRLRDSWGTTDDGHSRSLKEVTVKSKDKGNNFDRLEINLGITSSQDAEKLLTLLAGEPLGEIRKREFIVFTRDQAVLSIAEIGSDLFLEIEGQTEEQVRAYSKFILAPFHTTPETRNLYEIYVAKAA